MAGESSVKLLYVWASPYSMRAELALAFKEVEHEKVAQDLSNKSQLLLQSNPVYKKIPVLLHQGKPVCESSIIVQYVDEAWPSPSKGANLLPSDPYERAVARFWADFVDKKVFEAYFAILKSKGEEQKVAIENAMGVTGTLEEALGSVAKEPPFFGGGAIGYVDIMLGPLVVWLPVFEEVGDFRVPLEGKYPRLHGWFCAFREHPISAILPEAPKLIDFVSRFVLKRLAQ